MSEHDHQNVTSIELAMSALRGRVRALVDSDFDHVQFVHRLAALAQHGHEILNPRSLDQSLIEGRQRRDILKAYGKFQNEQKVVDFAHEHKLTLPHNEFWWWLNDDDRTAWIEGLEKGSRGIPRITNGIDVYLELGDGSLFKGHRDWLKYDRRPRKLTPREEASAASVGLKTSDRDHSVAKSLIENQSVDEFFSTRYTPTVNKPKPAVVNEKSLAYCVAEYFDVLLNKIT